jgi:hypothetical protein
MLGSTIRSCHSFFPNGGLMRIQWKHHGLWITAASTTRISNARSCSSHGSAGRPPRQETVRSRWALTPYVDVIGWRWTPHQAQPECRARLRNHWRKSDFNGLIIEEPPKVTEKGQMSVKERHFSCSFSASFWGCFTVTTVASSDLSGEVWDNPRVDGVLKGDVYYIYVYNGSNYWWYVHCIATIVHQFIVLVDVIYNFAWWYTV